MDKFPGFFIGLIMLFIEKLINQFSNLSVLVPLWQNKKYFSSPVCLDSILTLTMHKID